MKRLALIAIGVLLASTVAAATPEDVARELSQLIINTRSVVARNFTEPAKPWWLPNALYRLILVRNEVLPAAIAGKAFHPLNKNGIISLKMVVAEPRNENNQPDPTERVVFERVVKTGSPVAVSTPEAAYHGRPIKAAEWCLRCHGAPRGVPDPSFPQFKKEGWKVEEVVGAAIAKVVR